jgi:hypothetical protein
MAVETTVSSFDKLEAVVRSSAIYELAKVIPEREPGEVGRPFEFPTYMPFIFEALISVYGSARKVDAELQHRYVWKILRRLVKKVFPNYPEMHLPPHRYRRHHYVYFRNRYMANPVILEQLQESTENWRLSRPVNSDCSTLKEKEASRIHLSTDLSTQMGKWWLRSIRQSPAIQESTKRPAKSSLFASKPTRIFISRATAKLPMA